MSQSVFASNDGFQLGDTNMNLTFFHGPPARPIPGASFSLPRNALLEFKGPGPIEGITEGNARTSLPGARNDKFLKTLARHREKKMSNGLGGSSQTSNQLYSYLGSGSFIESLAPPKSARQSDPFANVLNASSKLSSLVLGSNGNSFGFATDFSDPSGDITTTTLASKGFDVSNLMDEEEMASVNGYATNGFIVTPEIRIITDFGCEAPGKNDVVIMEIESTATSKKHTSVFENHFPNIYGKGRNFGEHKGYHISAFNYMVALCQTYQKDVKSMTWKERDDIYTTHKNIIYSFAVMGGCDSEIYKGGGASFSLAMDPIDNEQRKDQSSEKSLNIRNEGSCFVKNIWGPVQAGTNLYFIWMKVKKIPEYITDTRRDRIDMIFGGTGIRSMAAHSSSQSGATLSPMPFQLIPWADTAFNNNTPPPEVIEFESDTDFDSNIKRTATVIFVGQVLHPHASTKSDYYKEKKERENHSKRAMRDYNVGSDDILEINIDPKFRDGDLIYL